MCGRGEVDYSAEKIREAFAHLGDELEVRVDLAAPRLNVAPMDLVPVVHRDNNHLIVDDMRWGGESNGRRPLHIVRSESVARGSLASRTRGLVLFTKFYEWHGAKGTKRKPFAVGSSAGDVLALAALCHRGVSADGEVIESCTILTQPALGPLVAIHDRMPIVVSGDHLAAWLAAQTETTAALDIVRADQLKVAEALRTVEEDPYVRARGPRPTKARAPQQGSLF